MKKSPRKLTIRGETVRALAIVELELTHLAGRVVGGDSAAVCAVRADSLPSQALDVNTCTAT